MARIRFGTAWVFDDPNRFLRAVVQGEDAGFDLVGMGDSQSLFPDVYSLLTLAAEHTTRMMVGTTVTNPVTRHPTVSAGAISTIQQVSGGRAFFGLGSGDSSVVNIGTRPASYRAVGEYGQAVRALTNGETVAWEGSEFAMHRRTQRVPLYLVPEGPKGLEQAGRIADGVFLNNGITKEVIEDSLHRIAEGARSAGRTLDDIDVWLAVRGFYPAATKESALEAVKFQLAGTVNHVFRFTLDGKLVPEQHREGIVSLQRDYRSDAHFNPDRGRGNAALLDRYNLTEWARDRFAIAGPPEYCVERLQELVDWGVTSFFISHKGPDVDQFGKYLREDILPRFR